MNKKIVAKEKLFKILKEEQNKRKVIGFTNGCFDIIHSGHVKYLKEAKENCDVLILAVNSDSSVKRIKGPKRPINNQEDRMEVLSSLEFIDYVTLFEENTPENIIKYLTPDILFKGGDWKEEDVVGGDHVKANGGKVRIINYVDGVSTTNTIEKILEVYSEASER